MVKKLGFVFLSQHWVPQKFFGGPQFGHACHRGLRILPTVRVKHDRTIQISSSVEKWPHITGLPVLWKHFKRNLNSIQTHFPPDKMNAFLSARGTAQSWYPSLAIWAIGICTQLFWSSNTFLMCLLRLSNTSILSRAFPNESHPPKM